MARPRSPFALALALALPSCAISAGDGVGGAGGQGEGGGEPCPGGNGGPLFTLRVKAVDEARLPADTTITISWSAGEEPAFVLADPETWAPEPHEGNVACVAVPADPEDAELVVCELWTSGPTEVLVTASGYLLATRLLVPEIDPECDEVVSSSVQIELEPEPDEED